MWEREPLVSVILPTYNRAKLTQRALKSVQEQSYSNLEIIIIDDGSSISERIDSADFTDSRISIHSTVNRGVSSARNFGISSSSGEYIALLDSDDEWMPSKISKQVAFLNESNPIGLCHTEEQWIRNGQHVTPRLIHKKASGEAFRDCLLMCCISPSATMLRRSVLDEIGVFDERMRVCEDYDLWLRYSVLHEVALLPEQLVRKYGGHQDQLSRSEPAIDRYRVFSLCKLLLSEALNESQIEHVKTEILQKLSVLSLGAAKRDNQVLLSVCGRLATAVELGNLSEISEVYTQLIELGIVS